MAWYTVSIPASAKDLLRKKGRGDFSLVQQLEAAIHLYTRLPPYHRLQLARKYAARSRQGKRTTKASVDNPNASSVRGE